MVFNEEPINDRNDKIVVSLGNNCLTSMLLRENNMKFESHPFDWMLTCIENIIHIFEDNFKEFLNKNNYVPTINLTKNEFYFKNTFKIFSNQISDHVHHDLLNETDYSYYLRAIDRLNTIHLRYEKIVFVMIQHLYLKNLEVNIDNIKKLYDILFTRNGNKIKLLVFNIVKEKNDVFKREDINENLVLIELDTNMEIGNYDMMYFDKNGIDKFLTIIKEI